MNEPALVIMPAINCWDYTLAAIHDALRQTLKPTVLLIDNGSTDMTRQGADEIAWEHPELLVWHHEPPLPSLSATWNTALQFAWDCGYPDVLVVNNDVRLHAYTYEALRRRRIADDAWFVTGIGVTQEDFEGDAGSTFDHEAGNPRGGWFPTDIGGGPDFSCFCITQMGHETYPFDEGFVPAYHEDNDVHRRYQLGGHDAKIFGCAAPFLHWGSRTVNQSDEFMAKFHGKFAGSERYYKEKWGGPVGGETFDVPWNGAQP